MYCCTCIHCWSSWDFIRPCAVNFFDFLCKLNSLKVEFDKLKKEKDRVSKGCMRLNNVSDWLGRVEEEERQTNRILGQEENQLGEVEGQQREINETPSQEENQLESRSLGCCSCPTDWSSYWQTRDDIKERLSSVTKLLGEGRKFEVVAFAEKVRTENTVRLKAFNTNLNKVWTFLKQDQERIICIWGKGGAGKTSFLTEINNEFLKAPTLSSLFDVVIWVPASQSTTEIQTKEIQTKEIQTAIGRRLGLKGDEDVPIVPLIRGFLENKRVLLLVAQLWHKLDPEEVGVPTPNNRNKSIVVFGTQKQLLRDHMNAKELIPVNCLEWGDAWTLFQETVGETARGVLVPESKIRRYAESIVKECDGLPLALVAMASEMMGKTTETEWQCNLMMIQNSAPKIPGMNQKVFPVLKRSYDNLGDREDAKLCFLYCSLFPKNCPIGEQELILYWIGEGFLDGAASGDLKVAQVYAHTIINDLKRAGLLESGESKETIKMNNMIRELAKWIASDCGGKKEKNLVQAGTRLGTMPNVTNWMEVERISWIDHQIRNLSVIPNCPNLSTLILRKNILEDIKHGFFRLMPSLKVLDLSCSNIGKFPDEIVQLVTLQSLNLSHTDIQNLPITFRQLVNLKILDLSCMRKLHTIPPGVISSLTSLQLLNMFDCGNGDRMEGSIFLGGGENVLKELENLGGLTSLGITIKSAPAIEILKSYTDLQSCINSLLITNCDGLKSLQLSFVRNMTHLNVLKIQNCLDVKDLRMEGPRVDNGFQSLCDVKIGDCQKLEDLSCLMLTPKVRSLTIQGCMKLAEIVRGVTALEPNQVISPDLKYLHLSDLPGLESVHAHAHALSSVSLEEVTVLSCPKLKKLPFDISSANKTLKVIKGQQRWWNELEQPDGATRSTFSQIFVESKEGDR